jgi:YjbE family integral membrane protein
MEFIQTADFWIGLFNIILINIILSGDNAVVIALAARSLPPKERKLAILYGSGAAVVLRILLTVVAAKLLELPYLQIIGGLLLLWIGVQLLAEEDDGEEGEAKEHSSLRSAMLTILVADLVMSLDNVIGVAAAAKGSMTLLVLGLTISIPLIVFSSNIMMNLMARFPLIITLGAALIGWVSGEAVIHDTAIHDWVQENPVLNYAVPAVCAAFVVVVGKYLQRKSSSEDTPASETH